MEPQEPKMTEKPSIQQKLAAVWAAVFRFSYPLCYYIGIQTTRYFRLICRRLYSGVWMPLARFFRAVWRAVMERRIENFRVYHRKCQKKMAAERETIERLQTDDRQRAVLRRMLYPFRTAWTYRRYVTTVFNYVAPVAAFVVMLAVIARWTGDDYALYVTYQGANIGYVSDEVVFEQGLEMAKNRVAPIDSEFTADGPEMTIAAVPSDLLLNKSEVCNAILESYGDEVTEMAGLYVEGTLVGALETEKEVQALLDSILSDASSKAAKKETIRFLEQVEILPGLYPSVSLLTKERMHELLTDKTLTQQTVTVSTAGETLSSLARENGLSRVQLLDYNRGLTNQLLEDKTLPVGTEVVVKPSYAYLHIQSLRTEVVTTYTPFDSITVKDYNRVLGHDYIKIEGEEGEIDTTYEIVTVDGEEISRNVLSSVKTKEPVTQVYAEGAMVLGGGSGIPGQSTGKFIWPVVGFYRVTSPWGWRTDPVEFHYGIDIYQHGIYGAEIIAMDGGTVIDANYSGYGGGWGHWVLIDHGNGYVSRYTHCSTVVVSVGEKVAQGQLIAYVGETGRTTGPGMHLEITYYGQKIDPLPLLNYY